MLKFNITETSLWYSSDLHCLHKNICYGTSRWDNKEGNTRMFDDPNQMTDHIIGNINDLVKPDDHLFLLGDLLFHYKDVDTYLRLINRFNCNNIYLLYGNHDHRNNLAEVLKHTNKIKFLGDYLEITVNGVLFCMQHYPIENWNDRHHTSYMLHGHNHGNNRIIPRRLDVGIDSMYKLTKEYKPFSYEDILKYIPKNE